MKGGGGDAGGDGAAMIALVDEITALLQLVITSPLLLVRDNPYVSYRASMKAFSCASLSVIRLIEITICVPFWHESVSIGWFSM